MINIGSRIKEIRESRGISGKQLAMELNFSQSFISQIENGNKKCSLETLCEICKTLKISLADFFSTDKPMEVPQLSPLDQRLLQASKNLSPAQLKTLTLFLQSLDLDKENI